MGTHLTKTSRVVRQVLPEPLLLIVQFTIQRLVQKVPTRRRGL